MTPLIARKPKIPISALQKKQRRLNLLSKTTPHLDNLIKNHPEIKKQFVPSGEEQNSANITLYDPLLEENHTVVKGLVHKYDNRALALLTMNCGAYCRFCTRRRCVSDIKKGILTEEDLDNMAKYLIDHPQIKELILSGGDPLTVPVTLKSALSRFAHMPQIKVIRVGSRLPIVNPEMINDAVIEALGLVVNQPLYVMLHFEHPAEITPETIAALKRLKTVSSMIFSQSVFLKGVNDSYETLYELFSRLIEVGVKPYYIYHCDPVKGAEHFIVPIQKEVEIMTKLRKNLSGLAYPTHVIDTPNGSGKIPVPLGFWETNLSSFSDFDDAPKSLYS